MESRSNLWAIVLAGGEGRRLASLTIDAEGRAVPKQFFRFRGQVSMLGRSLERASRLVGPEHVLVVVQEDHRRWWSAELGALDRRQIVSQPPREPGDSGGGKGTGVAVLHALARLLGLDPRARAIILPSDHGADDESAWLRSLRRVIESLEPCPSTDVAVLGVASPGGPDYGWIVPGPLRDDGTQRVAAFVEKPDARLAEQLASRGALCSACVLGGTADALVGLYQRHAPRLLLEYVRHIREAGPGDPALGRAFAHLPSCDLSRDILEPAAAELRLIRAERCGWSDLGTPARLAVWLERHPDPIGVESLALSRPRSARHAKATWPAAALGVG